MDTESIDIHRIPTNFGTATHQNPPKPTPPVVNFEASPGWMDADGDATVAAVAGDGDGVRGATKPSPRKPPRHRTPRARITIDLTMDLSSGKTLNTGFVHDDNL